MKKTLACLLMLALTVTCVCVLSLRTNATTNGTCGDNLAWTLDDAGTLTISGTGEMTNYASANATPWSSKRSSIKNVVVESGVTTIGDAAFMYCSRLTSVTIPDSVATIGSKAFYSSGVTSVTIPENVSAIGKEAFAWCMSLKEIRVSENNTAYSSDAHGVLFDKNKTTLIQAPGKISGSYIVPDSVTTIDGYAFTYCSYLTALTMGDNVTTIGKAAFYYCSGLTAVTIGNGVTDIGEYAFYWCASLNTVTMGDSVAIIDKAAFSLCTSLTKVELPASVTAISGDAFAYCDALTGIYVNENNTAYSSDDSGVLFNKEKTTLLQAPGKISGSYTIPSSVTAISEHAFENCTKLAAVELPGSVITVGNYAFSFCERLTTVTMDNSVTNIGDHAFAYCNSLKTVYYSADSEKWNQITVGSDNECLMGATIHYEHVHDYSTVPAVTVAATCQKEGYVEYTCIHGDTYRETLPRVPHSYTGTATVVEPTCTEEGYTNVACIWCDSVEKTAAVAALGHDAVVIPAVAPTCIATGLTEGSRCSRCQGTIVAQTVVPVVGHSYADGSCTVCGQAEYIPGDLDGVSGVNEDDAIYLLRHVLMGELFPVDQDVDFNRDGMVNEDDAIYLLRHVLLGADAFPL